MRVKRAMFAMLIGMLGFSAAPSHAWDKSLSADQARAIAKEAYVYGYPMVDNYRVMYAFSVDSGGPQYKGPFNQVLNVARVFTPADTAFVTPNSDTPYTFLGLDLRAEPVVLSVPRIEAKRYFVFQLMDLYTFNFDYIGTRATGNGGGVFLLAGPGWHGKTPPGITKVIRSETDLVSVVGRTQLFDPADLGRVKALQAQYRAQPLSEFLHRPAPPAAKPVQWLQPLAPEAQRSSPAFFEQLAFALQFAPTHPSEKALRQRFSRIGVVPGAPLDTVALSAERQEALRLGMQDGQRAIDARRAATGGDMSRLFGTRAFLKNDYLARATGAQMGIGANSREEALYPIYEKDADGQPLNGASDKYVLRFAPGSLPPVKAFWSLTLYGLPQQLLVANPIDRYLINSPMLPALARDPDGGLTIVIQNPPPEGERQKNWLPAPAGPFMLTMRYYLPEPALLQGKWKSPEVRKAP